MIAWIKKLALGTAIRELDQLEPIFTAKIIEAQKTLGAIPADQFSKVLVDDIQRFICNKTGIDPKSIGVDV